MSFPCLCLPGGGLVALEGVRMVGINGWQPRWFAFFSPGHAVRFLVQQPAVLAGTVLIAGHVLRMQTPGCASLRVAG
jgi:hypothetical protein